MQHTDEKQPTCFAVPFYIFHTYCLDPSLVLAHENIARSNISTSQLCPVKRRHNLKWVWLQRVVGIARDSGTRVDGESLVPLYWIPLKITTTTSQ